MLLLGLSDASGVTDIIAGMIYVLLALIAMWGAFCVIMVWRRVDQKRFKSEEDQDQFLDTLDGKLLNEGFDAAEAELEGDLRAMPQLALLAIRNRSQGYTRVRHLLPDRFQRDVLAELEHGLSWVHTVIKSAPMVGLLGTVIGMMGAFAKLAGGSENPDPTALADDINVALRTTACGLAIAIPLVLCTASVNVRIRKMEDLVGAGLTRFLESFKTVMQSRGSGESKETS